MQKPSVGRIVHYRSYGTPRREFTAECRAAIITSVADTDTINGIMVVKGLTVGLAVHNPTGLFFHETVHYVDPDDGGHVGGTWHWPERVD